MRVRSLTWRGLMILGMAVAAWPVWRWYFNRMTDGSDEPWGVLALLTLVLLRGRDGKAIEWKERSFVLPGLLFGLYAAVYGLLVPMFRAGLVLAAFALVLLRGRGRAGLWGLLGLSLPVVATLQFYAGAPLCLLAARVSAVVLQGCGFAVMREGTMLHWAGETVMVDAPCSGVHMLWAGMYLSFALAAAYRLAWRETLILSGAGILLVVGANVARATALFLKEAHILSLPDWTHAGTGLLLFAAAGWAVLGLAERLRERRTSNIQRPTSKVDIRLLPVGPCRGMFFLVCGAAALAPRWERVGLVVAHGAPAWPATFENRTLVPVELSAAEQRFHQGFPGAVARFTDGERELIFRWTTLGTRKLHPSADCFRGLGYQVTPLAPRVDGRGARWGCFRASRGSLQLLVRERIADSASSQSWCDASSWYWSTLLRQSAGPWLAIAVIEAFPETAGIGEGGVAARAQRAGDEERPGQLSMSCSRSAASWRKGAMRCRSVMRS